MLRIIFEMLLIMLIGIPFLSALLSLQSVRFCSKFPRIISLLAMFFCLCIAIFFYWKSFFIYSNHNNLSNIWISEFSSIWIPKFGIFFHIGIDKFSVLMIILTSIIGIFAILCEWNKNYKNLNVFYCFFLLIITAIFGIFLSIDLFLFFCFWEVLLLPFYFLVIFWNKKIIIKQYDYIYRARKFFIYSQLSGLFLLISILMLVWNHYIISGIWTFNYVLLRDTYFSFQTETFLMFSFFLAFAIKMPLVPFHSWLPDIQQCTPVSGSIDLIGILLKISIYGFLKFSLMFFPRSIHFFSLFFLFFGLLSIFYGAVMAFLEKNMKRLVSYSSISHMGVIFIALHSGSIIAYQGIVIYIISYTLSSAALLIIIGKIKDYVKTYNFLYISGLYLFFPTLSTFFLFFSLVNLGLPGTGNFVGEFMMLFGIFRFFPYFSIIIFFIFIFSSIYYLNMVHKICYGVSDFKKNVAVLTKLDLSILFVLTIIIIIIGFYPKFIINYFESILNDIYKPYIPFL